MSTTTEELVVQACFSQIQSLRDTHPEYFAYFEDVDPDVASRADLLDLIASAPTDAVKFFLLGKFTMRMAIAAVTGREFK